MKHFLLLLTLSVSLATSGCVAFRSGAKKHRHSSTIEFLYPKGRAMTDQPGIPHLKLPLSVGIAFVPDSRQGHHRSAGPPEERKMELLEAVAKQFKERPFIRSIEIIPTTYLKPGGGFANLGQLRTMLGIDVIALVAYDQIQHTDEDWASLSYLTIVGAFVVRGEKNDTSTMLDTSVFHIPSRKLLFRAPGTSQIKARATLVNHSEQLRKDAHLGMADANVQMIANLGRELDRFKKRVKEQPKQFKVSHAAGYHGAGNLGPVGGLLICLLLLIAWRRDQFPAQ